jgi:hypothetical protein
MEGRDSRGHPLRGRNVMRGSAVGCRVTPPRRERTSRTQQPLKSVAPRRGERQEGQRATKVVAARGRGKPLETGNPKDGCGMRQGRGGVSGARRHEVEKA